MDRIDIHDVSFEHDKKSWQKQCHGQDEISRADLRPFSLTAVTANHGLVTVKETRTVKNEVRYFCC
jgi:hypothetical protein